MKMRTAFPAGALAALAAATLTLSATPAFAGPSDYVLSPIVEQGEREIDFKAGSAKARDGAQQSKASLGLGWGINASWFSEIYAIWHKPAGEGWSFDAWEWENKFQLTETGRYPVDVGFLFEIERPRDRSEGYELRWGPLLQTELTPMLQANLNLLLEKHVRAAEPSATELGYQWQLKYRWRPELEFGMQGFGDFGPWRRWEPSDEQPHQAGPALFGRIRLDGHQTIKYNAALLLGLSDGAPRHTLRLQAEYEF